MNKKTSNRFKQLLSFGLFCLLNLSAQSIEAKSLKPNFKKKHNLNSMDVIGNKSAPYKTIISEKKENTVEHLYTIDVDFLNRVKESVEFVR